LASLDAATVVFGLALLTAIATGLGALPFAVRETISPRAVAASNVFAAGLMLGAGAGLRAEGIDHGYWRAAVGSGLGGLFVLGVYRYLETHEVQFFDARGGDARRMLIMVIVMAVHSLAEGVALGAAYAGGIELATIVTVAIAVHNVPEGLAITAVLRARGQSIPRCAWWSIFSSLPQPIMAVPAYLFVDTFTALLPGALGFAAGAMIMMVFLEILPEVYGAKRRDPLLGFWATVAVIAMFFFQRGL